MAEQTALRADDDPDNLLRPWLGEMADRLWRTSGFRPAGIDLLSFASIVPCTVALVELDAGTRMAGRVLGRPEDVRAGMRVTAAFEAVTDQVSLVHWQPLTG